MKQVSRRTELPNTSNILDLADPEDWVCLVESWGVGLSHLKIVTYNVKNKRQTLEVEFSGAYYYQGESGWRGANFQIASDDECMQYLRKLQISLTTDPLEQLLEDLHLFKVKTLVDEVKIIAEVAIIHDIVYIEGPTMW